MKEKVRTELLSRIENGVYAPGEKLPTERSLAKEFGSTLWCVHSIMDEFEVAGFVERRRSVGTFVCENFQMDKVQREKTLGGKTVVVIVSKEFFYGQYAVDIIGSLEQQLEAKEFNVVYENFPENEAEISSFLQKCQKSCVKAITIFPEKKEWDLMHRYNKKLSEYPGNIYYFNRGLGPDSYLTFNSLGLDMFQSGLMAANWIVDHDIKNIALCRTRYDAYWLSERVKAIDSQLLRYDLSRMDFKGEPIQEIFESVKQFVEKSDTPPALVMTNDKVAAPVYEYLEFKGFKAGKDFYMISFDNHPAYRHCKFISISWPLDKIGMLMADMICNDENNTANELCIKKYHLTSQIVERNGL